MDIIHKFNNKYIDKFRCDFSLMNNIYFSRIAVNSTYVLLCDISELYAYFQENCVVLFYFMGYFHLIDSIIVGKDIIHYKSTFMFSLQIIFDLFGLRFRHVGLYGEYWIYQCENFFYLEGINPVNEVLMLVKNSRYVYYCEDVYNYIENGKVVVRMDSMGFNFICVRTHHFFSLKYKSFMGKRVHIFKEVFFSSDNELKFSAFKSSILPVLLLIFELFISWDNFFDADYFDNLWKLLILYLVIFMVFDYGLYKSIKKNIYLSMSSFLFNLYILLDILLLFEGISTSVTKLYRTKEKWNELANSSFLTVMKALNKSSKIVNEDLEINDKENEKFKKMHSAVDDLYNTFAYDNVDSVMSRIIINAFLRSNSLSAKERVKFYIDIKCNLLIFLLIIICLKHKFFSLTVGLISTIKVEAVDLNVVQVDTYWLIFVYMLRKLISMILLGRGLSKQFRIVYLVVALSFVEYLIY